MWRALLLLLWACPVWGQIKDEPITSPPPSNAVVSVDLVAGKGCAGWWRPSTDPFGDYVAVMTAVDLTALDEADRKKISDALNSRNYSALVGARTMEMSDPRMKAASKPCWDKMGAVLPPPRWIVAPLASGERPAYVLGEDKKRGKQDGTAPVMLEGKPTWCNCLVRSIETTSSVYCAWATMQRSFDVTEPIRVTLCRANKVITVAP